MRVSGTVRQVTVPLYAMACLGAIHIINHDTGAVTPPLLQGAPACPRLEREGLWLSAFGFPLPSQGRKIDHLASPPFRYRTGLDSA